MDVNCLKGFCFEKQIRAWISRTASQADNAYGDTFARSGQASTGIGNNISPVFNHMDFGDCTHAALCLDGCTSLTTNPVAIRFTNADGEQMISLAQFAGTQRSTQSFDLSVLRGECSVELVFPPGSQFDFYGFTFLKP